MTTPTIRAALERLVTRLQETTDPEGPVPAWSDSLYAALDTLAAAPEGEPSDEELEATARKAEIQYIKQQGGFGGDANNVVRQFKQQWIAGLRAIFARWGRPATPPAAPVGEGLTDKELLSIASDCRALYVADDADDDNYAEVLAAMRAAIAADRATPPAPMEGEVGELVRWLGVVSEQFRLADLSNEADQTDRAATLLEQLSDLAADAVAGMRYIEGSHGRLYGVGWDRVYAKADALNPQLSAAAPAVVPVAVSERLPGDELCWWYEPDEDDDGSGYGGNWTLLRIRGGVSCYTHWLPAHALPLPAPQGGEVEA